MKSFINLITAALLAIALTGCGNGNGQTGGMLSGLSRLTESSDNTTVNAIAQAKPEIMVIPSDNMLRKYYALDVVTKNGVDYYERDYSKYLLANPDNKASVSAIQDEFIKMGYPLTDLEQTLKRLGDKSAKDAANNVAMDAKTLLLQTASPDIIIELDYVLSMDNNDISLRRSLSYTLTAFDAYTNKSISSKTISGVNGTSFKDMLTSSLHKSTKGLAGDIKNYFAETITQGREITVRFLIDKGSNITFGKECSTGDTYTDWVMDYMDLNAKKGTYKLQNNTDYEIFFTNVRIPVLREDGTQFSAYHWARKCVSAIRSDCGVKASNNVQGLGNVEIIIKGF